MSANDAITSVPDCINDKSTYIGRLKYLYNWSSNKNSYASEDNFVSDGLFTNWINAVFDVYDENIVHFILFVEEIIKKSNSGKNSLSKTQVQLLKKYFSVFDNEQNRYIDFFGNGSVGDWGDFQKLIDAVNDKTQLNKLINDNGYRLNIEPTADRTKAKICELFPKKLQSEFNKLFCHTLKIYYVKKMEIVMIRLALT